MKHRSNIILIPADFDQMGKQKIKLKKLQRLSSIEVCYIPFYGNYGQLFKIPKTTHYCKPI